MKLDVSIKLLVSNAHAQDWPILAGVLLGTREGATELLIERIKNDNPGDETEQCYQMLTLWEERWPAQATVQALIDAIRGASLLQNGVADQLSSHGQMGLQHSTCVWNNSCQAIKVVLEDCHHRTTTQYLKAGDVVQFPTPHGKVTLSAFRAIFAEIYDPQEEARISWNSDGSFVVKEVGRRLTFFRTIKEGLRK